MHTLPVDRRTSGPQVRKHAQKARSIVGASHGIQENQVLLVFQLLFRAIAQSATGADLKKYRATEILQGGQPQRETNGARQMLFPISRLPDLPAGNGRARNT